MVLLSAWLQDMHFLYVLVAANLYARMHRLPGSQSQTELRELLKLLLEPGSTPQNLFSAEFGEAPVLYSSSCLSPPLVFSLCLEGRCLPKWQTANLLPFSLVLFGFVCLCVHLILILYV